MNYFKKIILKIKINLRNKFRKKIETLSDHEKICFEIFRKYLYHDNSKLMMSPETTSSEISNSYKRYICIGNLYNPSVAIIITFSTIKIINHTYYYTININKQLYLKIIDMFDRKITKERNIMEMAIHKNITDGLIRLIK